MERKWKNASLKAYRQKMSYVRRQGCNIVSIQVHESSNKQMYHMLLGMAGGILTLGLPFNMEFLLSFFFAALLVTFTFPCVPGSTVLALASIFEMADLDCRLF